MSARRRVLSSCLRVAGGLSRPGVCPGQDHTPQPYSPDEFPGWMKDLWRAEAILVGSFPLTLFVTLEAYDPYRYVNTGFNPTYAPWPFGTGNTINLSTQEATWLVVSAVGLSLTVAVIDFLIGRWNATSNKP